MTTEQDDAGLIDLRLANIGRLSDRFSVVPTYLRDGVNVGIAHIGVGNFHRAHQAMFTDRLLHQGARDWAICGVGLMPADEPLATALADQDLLYSLIDEQEDERNPQIVGSIREYIRAWDSPRRAVERLTDPDIRVLTITVTENGYHADRTSNRLNTSSPAIQQDLLSPDSPRTLPGLIYQVGSQRLEAGIAVPTMISCDNIPENGKVLRQVVLDYAREVDTAIADRIQDTVSFPSTMVDRITPVTTDAHRERLRRDWGMVDRCPVFCEQFAQWFIDDRFGGPRPPYEDVGVSIVRDVRPYELMKIRLLNGTHSALSYIGLLLEYDLVQESLEDDDMREFVAGYLREMISNVPKVPGVDLPTYADSLVSRFRNPAVPDRLERLAQDGSQKIPNAILSALTEAVSNNRSIKYGAFAIAGWMAYAQRCSRTGQEIDDPLGPELLSMGAKLELNPEVFFEELKIFPRSLQESSAFRNEVIASFTAISKLGLCDAMRAVRSG